MSESTYRLALVVSQFNPEVTHGLRDGALAHLAENGVSIAPDHVYSAPGAFEIPLIAKRLAQSGFDGVICLGCVIKGDTAHVRRQGFWDNRRRELTEALDHQVCHIRPLHLDEASGAV